MDVGQYMAVAAPDNVWDGRLFLKGANPRVDDPVWSCDHNHKSADEAVECARIEAMALAYKSKYAQQTARLDQSHATLTALGQLDLEFAAVEELGSLLSEVTIAITCRRILHAWMSGLESCELPHEIEGDERS